MKLSILVALVSTTAAFTPSKLQTARASFVPRHVASSDVVTKPTGTSFLPEEAVERAKIGNPIEKAKMAKDPTNAWIDVYEYARKIREGEMTWEDVEKADLDSVSIKENWTERNNHVISEHSLTLLLLPTFFYTASQICRYAASWKTHAWKIHDASQGPQRYCQFRPDALLCRLC